jgi:hypothetical protein
MPVIDNRYYIGLPLPGRKCVSAKECFDLLIFGILHIGETSSDFKTTRAEFLK